MADFNYVIAIGGTGIRVMRALTHLCDCGHIDLKEIKLLIIDPDKINGSKKSLIKVLDLYNECHDRYSAANCPIFRTKISMAMAGRGDANPEWAISPVAGTPGQDDQNVKYHLNDYITYERNVPADYLMRALYSREEYAEKDMNEGFFAHPSLGALTFARWLDNSPEFNVFLSDIEFSLNSGNVKVFIIGSSFGGTGASGFPAVASKIRNFSEKVRGKGNNNVIIAGEFYLPYFMFQKPDDYEYSIDTASRGSGRKYIEFDDFLKAAKNAVAFYYDNNSVNAYDKIYVLGAPGDGNVRIVRNIYADKGDEQDNWPHMLELFGALGAKDFFDADDADLIKSSVDDPAPWVGIGVKKDDFYDIEWDDLPNSIGLDKLINRFLLMSYIYVPAVLSKFINIVNNDQAKLMDYKECNTFEPICRKPFTAGVFAFKKWSDEFSHESSYRRFINLNNYFAEHARWLCQLLSEFQPDGSYGDILYNRLIKCEILRRRIVNEWDTRTPIDEIGAEMIDNGTFRYGDITDDIDSETPKFVKSEIMNVAIGELVRGVYAQIAKQII